MATTRKPRREYTDKDRALILSLHKKGLGRNQIVRETGYNTATVSRIVNSAGESFARGAQVQAATEAKTADNKARRANIVSRLYGQAEGALDRLESGTYTTLVKGQGGAEHVEDLHFIPAGDRRSEASSLNTVLARAEALEKIDGNNGTERAESMLDKLSADMKEATRAVRNVPKTDPDDS